ncbi:sugar ABC transporter ATP-binding protein [Patulibacter defluvii]|uniref:sugar ABC transporter ATP-binding protein n=1 Tax=Patulibacter defluvii TaxID=3095358 RepID=UPI002A74B89B|nr:sugar ABC transporter ATP-binding protein [Patulibacter sp. DM4]
MPTATATREPGEMATSGSRDEVRLEHVSKTFGGHRALRDVSIGFRFGEIHGLVGENGAGKSTLFKILAGYHEPDDGGRLLVDGEPHALPLTPTSAAALGFGFVHQDLGLATSLTIMDNVCAGAMVTSRLGRIRWREQARIVERILCDLGVDRPASTPVEQLTLAERAVVAIARGVYARGREQARLLVLDEPTANLTVHERDRLFAAMRSAAARGTAIVFCTHRLDEVLAITDAVTVLRDGAVVRECRTAELEGQEDLVQSILGRALESFYPERPDQAGREVALEARELTGGGAHEISFALHRGEVLGLTGLAGSGQDDVPRLLVGDLRAAAGEVLVRGEPLKRPSPRRAVAAGIGFLPPDRKRNSGLLEASIRENMTLVSLDKHVRHGRIRHREERASVEAAMERYDVRPSGDSERLLGSLSGGNQQKVLLAKWMAREGLRCVILHEPTQGVDVGAKRFILERVADLTERGIGVLLVSSEPEELSALCDRVLVMRNGRIRAELHQPSAAAISEQCFLS